MLVQKVIQTMTTNAETPHHVFTHQVHIGIEPFTSYYRINPLKKFLAHKIYSFMVQRYVKKSTFERKHMHAFGLHTKCVHQNGKNKQTTSPTDWSVALLKKIAKYLVVSLKAIIFAPQI